MRQDLEMQLVYEIKYEIDIRTGVVAVIGTTAEAVGEYVIEGGDEYDAGAGAETDDAIDDEIDAEFYARYGIHARRMWEIGNITGIDPADEFDGPDESDEYDESDESSEYDE